MNRAGIIGAVREVVGWGRYRFREWYEWAAQNPEAMAIQLLSWAHFAEHRESVVSARRVVWRKSVRLAKLRSAAQELREFAEEIQAMGAVPPFEV